MFIEERLLDQVVYGSTFGQEFQTRVITLKSGHERRYANWTKPRGQYSVSYTALRPEDHALVRGAHMACMGSLIAFRLKDWTDFYAASEPLTTGTGSPQTVQLSKAYTFGSATLDRPIFKPVVGTVEVFADALLISSTIDYTTGMATFTANPGSVVTWSGEFDIPVRFVSDRLDVDPKAKRGRDFILGADADLIEVRL